MPLASLLQALGDRVQSAEEETFELFAQDLPAAQNLGFIDSRAPSLELTIAGRDLVIHQSPAVLSSNRAGGTTGAVLWKITPLFATWLASPATNPLFTHGILAPSSVVLELGCGIAALAGLLLAPHIARYVLTDQAYVARLVERNVAENWAAALPAAGAAGVGGVGVGVGKGKGRSRSRGKSSPRLAARGRAEGEERRGGDGRRRIVFAPLDWETAAVTAALTHTDGTKSFDLVVACDCVYNEALVEPFVATCVDACRLRGADGDDGAGQEAETDGRRDKKPCVCVVAQQLRDPLVFEAWLTRFARSFHVWRVPDGLLVDGLRSGSGFVVHMGVLKDGGDDDGTI